MASAGSAPPSRQASSLSPLARTKTWRGGNDKTKIALYLFVFLTFWSLLLQHSLLLWWPTTMSSQPRSVMITNTLEVGLSSLDQLLQVAATNGASPVPIECPTTNETTTLECKEDTSTGPLPLHDEVLYVNCAATQRENPAYMTPAPLSLLQCRDLLLSEIGPGSRSTIPSGAHDQSQQIWELRGRHCTGGARRGKYCTVREVLAKIQTSRDHGILVT
jgi:hypothetical protein